jgi:hypothetical protein
VKQNECCHTHIYINIYIHIPVLQSGEIETDNNNHDPAFVPLSNHESKSPTGTFVTAVVLTGGLISFRKGNPMLGQKFMRARVVAQGLTVVAIVYGSYDRIFPEESILAAKFTGYANYVRRHFGIEEHVRETKASKGLENAKETDKAEWSDVSSPAAGAGEASALTESATSEPAPATEVVARAERVSWYSYLMGASKPPKTVTSAEAPTGETANK